MFFGFSTPKMGGVLTKTFSKGTWGALDSHDWSTHDLSLGAVFSLVEVFGSPPYDGSFLEALGLDVHELSTHD